MMDATAVADAVRAGRRSARDVLDECLRAVRNDRLCAVTRVVAERARQNASDVDRQISAGVDPGPLAGVPFGVKDLFDVADLATSAGSRLYANATPASSDAQSIRMLRDAGAVLVATLNMDEFAYGFATINALHGTTRNPHDPARLAGGSSGGSAAAVAGGMFPFTLGSDTNGSIRVPASLTGLYGLKPTHGALPMGGVFPFADSFDDIGPFTTSARDMRLLWHVLGGGGGNQPDAPLRIARLGGRFVQNVDADQLAAIDAIAPDAPVVDMPDIGRARSAAFIITACEGGRLHRDALASDAMQFDPQVRDRLIAGALIPDDLYEQAQALRQSVRETALDMIAPYDIVIAPATPCVAPPIEDPRIMIDGALSAARADLGIHTQPISFIGFPSLAVPIYRPGRLPLGVQLIGQPGGEMALFDFAERLEQEGLIGFSAPGQRCEGEVT